MRSLVVFILLAFLTNEVKSSDCICYESHNYTGPSVPISNAYNPDGFSPCYVPCSFVAYTGDDTHGFTNLHFRWGTTTNSGGNVQIFDGPNENSKLLIQIAENENVLSGSSKSNIKSSSSRITIKYTQNGNNPNIYYGTMKASAFL